MAGGQRKRGRLRQSSPFLMSAVIRPYRMLPQDRETLDATLDAPAGTHEIRARPEVGGERIPLTDQQFRDLITVHVADFIEQVTMRR